MAQVFSLESYHPLHREASNNELLTARAGSGRVDFREPFDGFRELINGFRELTMLLSPLPLCPQPCARALTRRARLLVAVLMEKTGDRTLPVVAS